MNQAIDLPSAIFAGLFGALSIKGHLTTATSENCRPWAQQKIAGGRVLSGSSV